MQEEKYSLKNIGVSLNKDPDIKTRAILPFEEESDQNQKQFEVGRTAILSVEIGKDTRFTITARRGYEYDGATIPFNIGKGDMTLLVPALFHDIMCENKDIVFRNRELSTLIFHKLLIACGHNPIKASIKCWFVDQFQKAQKGWAI